MHSKTVVVNGLTISGYDEDYVFNTIASRKDFYEKNALLKWTPYIDKAKTILDIGANLGNHTLYWAQNVPHATIYSFEPYGDNFECLKKNVRDNNLEERVHPLNTAVGSVHGFVKIASFDASNLGGVTYEVANNKDSSDSAMISIDEFVVQNSIEKIDFVKIDTEGFEVEVLDGMQKTLTRSRPTIWIEVSAKSYRTVMGKLEILGYQSVDISDLNMLYVHEDLMCGDLRLNCSQVLGSMFEYLEKMNFYYGAYEKAKKEITQKTTRLEEYNDKYRNAMVQHDTLRSQCRQAVEDKKLVEQKLSLLQEEWDKKYKLISKEKNQLKARYDETRTKKQPFITKYSEVYSLNTEFAEEITAQVNYGQQQIALLQKLQQMIKSQQMQISYLKQENKSYKRKLSMITDTWYGKFAVKCYVLLKKMLRK